MSKSKKSTKDKLPPDILPVENLKRSLDLNNFQFIVVNDKQSIIKKLLLSNKKSKEWSINLFEKEISLFLSKGISFNPKVKIILVFLNQPKHLGSSYRFKLLRQNIQYNR